MPMIRTQVYFTEQQHQQIQRLADAQHKTMAQVIREAVEEYIAERSAKESAWWHIVNLGYSGITDGSIHHDRDIYVED